MYAIVKDGGHQFRAEVDEVVRLERKDAAEGDEIAFEEVLFVSDGKDTTAGTPTVSGARVVGVIEKHVKGKKIVGQKKREIASSKTRFGHRQNYTLVRIREIVAGK